ncbi:hypothetical protein RJ640_019238 [Escallonia rubra]|uniref:AAA+ ATPase domain-containing protein n=1 Tax=Escallonia rubra TaxID=112253 RepID=A0AA88R483_9ASTE|nr:hypothetical protein RJ640_019238 [Escallonia rubra]
MPGVGKTTMMEQVRNAMVEKKEFDEVAVAVVSATLDVKSIQGRLASDLRLYDLANADDESVRARLLRERLKNGKKILVILDDVWDKLPLEDMGLDFGDSRGCKILMTSRSERVCEANKCLRNFLINVLSQEEALGLFRQHAGNCIEDADIKPVAMEVLNECGGLPLIIRAVGEALKDGEQGEWKDARRQFKNFTPRNIVYLEDQVYQTLELSFSRLKPEEAKSCLLLCSLFPEDAEISIDDLSLLAMAMGFLGSMDSIEDARNRVRSLVKALKTSCLLLGCEDGDKVKLHDVIRDVAINIASEDVKYRFMVKSAVSAWPEMQEAHRATISLRIENIRELPRKLECPHDQLQTLIVGIYGMPGVGKTTMMEQVRRAMVGKKEFEEVAVAVVSATWDVKSIQGRLASDLRLYDLANADDESVRARLLRERLKNGKKILVILDDVWCNKLPLENIGIDFGDSRGCKILMTSRSERVCEANKCLRNFLINVLSQEEALGLFRQHAGNCIEDADIKPVAMEVLNECGGLPLIIRAVGEALKDGEQGEWKDARRQFKNFTPRNIVYLEDQVYQTLELSFSRLKPEEAKSCLLLCSLFPEDAEISIDDLSLLAMAMGFLGSMDSIEDARNRVRSLVKALKTSCLLLGCEDGDKVKLHDVIRDVAINIASEDVKYRFMVKSAVSAWPEMQEAHRATISLRIENIRELPRKLECPHDQLQTLMLDCSGDSYTKIPRTFLDGLEKLTVLILVNGLNAREQHVRLLSRMSTLRIYQLPKLQSLWNGDPRGILDLRSLTEIKIENCGLLKMLFSCSVVRDLEQLRKLTVEYCDMLETIVYDDEGKEGTGDDIEFPRLKFLELRELPKLSSFCSAKVSGPLHMRKTTKEHLESLWNKDPRGILDLRSLTEIKIKQCDLLKMLFSCSVVRTLEQLRVLVVKSCPMMETIVYDDEGKEGTGDDIGFPRLKFLYLEELPMLSSFCNAKVALTMSSLKAARLRNCPQMLCFSSGGLHLPKMTTLSSPARSSHVADLKEHLQASAIKINNGDFDDKELATAMDKDSDYGEMDLRLVVGGLTKDDENEIRRGQILGYGFDSAPHY